MENKIIKRNCYAKINLFLSIKDKRKDGYHNIETIFQTIDLHDKLTVEKTEGEVEINNIVGIPNDDRLEIKVAKEFFKRLNREKCGAKISIEKHIPIKAGLGGGSSDAGNTLVCLNELYDFPFTKEELIEMGLKFGSDIPFFIEGGCAYGTSRGEVLQRLKQNDIYVLIVLSNEEKISTKIAYEKLDTIKEESKKDIESVKDAIQGGNIDYLAENIYNEFECIYRNNEEYRDIHLSLTKTNPLACSLCGSGMAQFGLYRTFNDLEKAKDILSKKYKCYTSKTIGG